MNVAAGLLYLAGVVAMIVGWCLNLVAIFGMWGGDVNAELIIRLVGVPVFVLGGVAGYI